MAWSTTGARAQDVVEEEPQLPAGTSDAPRAEWEQILAAPRIGDRLSAVAVDPQNADRIYVGTEEGTVIRTTDGGITWSETTVSPFNVLARSVGGTGIDLFTFQVPTEPFEVSRIERDRSSLVLDAQVSRLSDEPTEQVQRGILRFVPSPNPLLQEAIRNRVAETVGVVRIEICPGGRYPLLAATEREVFGSMDDGRTFIRLFNGSAMAPFSSAGLPQITGLACSPANPNDIVIATARGSVRSTDGGLTFSDDVRGTTAGFATSVAWDFATEAGTNPALLISIGTFLFVGDPDSEGGLAYIYPDHGRPLPPITPINWITTTPSAQIWIATDLGVRASLDGGITFTNPSPLYIATERVVQVAVGLGESGRERVAAVLNRIVYTTDDSGTTWHPYFAHMSRRTVRRVVAGPADPNGDGTWFVLTTGELWRTVAEEPPPAFDTSAIRQRAQQALAQTPPLARVLQRVFELQDLTAADINDIFDGASDRFLLPVLGVELDWAHQDNSLLAANRGPTFPRNIDRQQQLISWSLFLTATWSLPDYWWPAEIEYPVNQLYQLQKQLGFLIEDAWHERRMHLVRLARDGYVDELQAGVLQERIGVLEALLEIWLGEPLDRFARRLR
jgi:hypothetical protein